MIIDAHQHFWELGRFEYGWLNGESLGPIRRSFLPSDLLPQLKPLQIDHTIFVQTQHHLEENRWVLGLARENPFIAGVVGWVDLASDECESQIEEFRANPQFVGVRHVTHDEPDDDFIIRPDVLRGLKILEKYQIPFDLLFKVRHLRHAVRLGQELPDLPMIIDHLSKPEIRAKRLDGWKQDVCAAAQFPQIHMKISGMVTEADWERWTPDDLRPYVDIVLEAFGPERCMFGSDWPVCELAGTYAEVCRATQETLGRLSRSEQAEIFGGTANRVYFGGRLS